MAREIKPTPHAVLGIYRSRPKLQTSGATESGTVLNNIRDNAFSQTPTPSSTDVFDIEHSPASSRTSFNTTETLKAEFVPSASALTSDIMVNNGKAKAGANKPAKTPASKSGKDDSTSEPKRPTRNRVPTSKAQDLLGTNSKYGGFFASLGKTDPVVENEADQSKEGKKAQQKSTSTQKAPSPIQADDDDDLDELASASGPQTATSSKTIVQKADRVTKPKDGSPAAVQAQKTSPAKQYRKTTKSLVMQTPGPTNAGAQLSFSADRANDTGKPTKRGKALKRKRKDDGDSDDDDEPDASDSVPKKKLKAISAKGKNVARRSQASKAAQKEGSPETSAEESDALLADDTSPTRKNLRSTPPPLPLNYKSSVPPPYSPRTEKARLDKLKTLTQISSKIDHMATGQRLDMEFPSPRGNKIMNLYALKHRADEPPLCRLKCLTIEEIFLALAQIVAKEDEGNLVGEDGQSIGEILGERLSDFCRCDEASEQPRESSSEPVAESSKGKKKATKQKAAVSKQKKDSPSSKKAQGSDANQKSKPDSPKRTLKLKLRVGNKDAGSKPKK